MTMNDPGPLPVPDLTGPRVRLRALAARDVDALYALHSDPRVMRYWSFPAWSERSQATGYIERIARERGVILADTKLEFGVDPATGAIVLGDEVLTPDSSRFWPADDWTPGRAQPSFDKQYVRDWLTSPASGWDRSGDTLPPPLPDDVVERTRARYLDAFERLTGHPLA